MIAFSTTQCSDDEKIERNNNAQIKGSCKTNEVMINGNCQGKKTCTENEERDPETNTCSPIENKPLPTVNISTPDLNILEDIETISISVTLSQASLDDISVPFTVTKDTIPALTYHSNDNNTYYDLQDGSFTISAGETTSSITFNVYNTSEYQADQKLTIELDTPTYATLGEDTQLIVVIEDTITDDTATNTAADELTAQSILADNSALDNITSSLVLPSSGNYETKITWSLPSSVQSGGNVTRPSYSDGNKTLTITATITKGDAQTSKDFTLTIIRNDPTDQEAVSLASSDLTDSQVLNNNSSWSNILTDLNFPTSGSWSTSISWSTNNSASSSSGVITRPSYSNGDQTVTITATVTKGNSQSTKEFTATVIKNDPNDSEAVSLAASDLTDSQVLNNNSSWSNILTDLNFPTSGSWNASINWSTNNSAIASDGGITRPAFDASNVSVEVTATITRGSAETTKSFNATVILSLPPLMITEVYGGQASNDGWVEIYNTTDVSITLSNYQIRTCTNSYPCQSTQSFTISSPSPSDPNIAIGSKQYMLIHRRDDETAVETDIYLDSIVFSYFHDLAEITEISSSKTIDYVRWSNSDYTGSSHPDPTTESFTFTGSVLMNNFNYETSIGRKFPLPTTDTNNADEWMFYDHASPGGPNPTYLPIASGTDSDGDGLSDDDEDNVYNTDKTRSDTDGDGFSDGQEVLDEGIAGINIKALGADPLKRDIFLEIDYMANPAGVTNSDTDTTTNTNCFILRKAALDKIKNDFDNYNPAGDTNTYSIQIHFDVGDLFDQSDGIDPNDDIMVESGEDTSTLINRLLVNGAMELNSMLDARFPIPIPPTFQYSSDPSSDTAEYDYVLKRANALITASHLAQTRDIELAESYYRQITNAENTGIIDRINDGRVKLSFERVENDSEGRIIEITKAGTMSMVELSGDWTGDKYDRVQVICTTGGGYGTAQVTVYSYDGTNLYGNSSAPITITGGMDYLINGISGRFEGNSLSLNDRWDFEVRRDSVTNPQTGSIELCR